MAQGFAESVRDSGRYGFQPVGGFIDPDPNIHWDPVGGQVMRMQYMYGSMRTATGRYWWPIRGFYEDRARYLHLSESEPGTDFHYATDENNSYGGPVEHGERDGKWGVWKPDGQGLLVTDRDTIEWNDGDELHIVGERVGEAMQFFCPDESEPLVYTSRGFRGSGTIKGESVSGLFFHDSMHMPAGTDFIKSAYITDLEAAWVVFATEFEDGTVHAGHLVHGTDGFDLMLVHRTDGAPFVARDVDVSVEFDGNSGDDTDFPTKVVYTGGGQTWIWEALPSGGRCPIRRDLPSGHRWRQGWVRHADETRRPKATEALMETYNGRLTATGAFRP